MNAKEAAKLIQKRKNQLREDRLCSKIDKIESKLAIVEEQGQLIHSQLKKENDIAELEAREEIRSIRIKRSVDHNRGLDEYLGRVHIALEKIKPNSGNLPNYIEMIRATQELGDKISLNVSGDKEEKKNPVQINLAVLTGAMPQADHGLRIVN